MKKNTKPPVKVFATPEALGEALAGRILQGIRSSAKRGRHYILGCPSGRSLRSTYQALGTLLGQTQTDCSRLIIAMMDDYVVPGKDAFVNCPIGAHFSCRRFAFREIFAVLNKGLQPSLRVRRQNVWNPDPSAPWAYDARFAQAGGIDFFLLASGASDGHVAFNGPGSALTDFSRIIPLADSTRKDNLKTFPQFRRLSEVPHFGVSVGLGTMTKFSKRVCMVIHGAHKHQALQTLLRRHSFSPDWPASLIYECKNALVFVDQAAFGRR